MNCSPKGNCLFPLRELPVPPKGTGDGERQDDPKECSLKISVDSSWSYPRQGLPLVKLKLNACWLDLALVTNSVVSKRQAFIFNSSLKYLGV